jgi:thiol-disulfide isomerase/thioredoxin
MRLIAALLIAASLMAAGCTSLASRSRERNRDRDTVDRNADRGRDDRPWWQDGPETASLNKTRPLPPAARGVDREGILAGVVIDGREGRPLKGVTYVRLRPAEEVAPASASGGMHFETDADGYFFVPGLTPGKTYILSVVREINGRKIAAEAQVKPPAGNIRLELDENKVSSTTPPLPPPPGMGPFENSVDPSVVRPPAIPDPPVGDRGWEKPASNGMPALPLDKENIAGNPMLPPSAAIRPPPTAAPSGPSRKVDDYPPTSRMQEQRVPNFVLSDVMGNDWEFRYASGQLILVDFWSTTCSPCLKAMPGMKRLQGDYGASGLEIVAVACEAEAPFRTRIRDVDDLARRRELNYKVYVEREGRVGEVQKLFGIQWLPTLVLLDRQGNVLWRGGATEADMARVEDIVKSYLSRR